MCRNRASLGFAIDDPRLAQDLIAKIPAKLVGRAQIDGPAVQHLRELLFHLRDPEPDDVPRPKFDKYIHVAVGSKVVSKDRPEQRQAADMMAPAELGNTFRREANVRHRKE